MNFDSHRTGTAPATSDLRGRIFDIKRFAVHDGPGIRTTVFFKGCPLRCAWCHNPEAIRPQPELVLYKDKCIECGACVAACPHGAHELLNGDGHNPDNRLFHRERCDQTGACVEACYAGALELLGREMSVEDVMIELRKDLAFFAQSGGGVTLSGGEPLAQSAFVLSLLKQCKQEGIHTALDTCGYAPWPTLAGVLPYVDLVLYDLKQMDAQIHQQVTGVSNERILANLRMLGDCSTPVEIRMPIIPTINDDRPAIEAAAQLLASLDNITAVRLLAYHRMAGSKYARLGREDTLPQVEPPTPDEMQRIAGWLRAYGLTVIGPEIA